LQRAEKVAKILGSTVLKAIERLGRHSLKIPFSEIDNVIKIGYTDTDGVYHDMTTENEIAFFGTDTDTETDKIF
jgi:hypothetical protein